MNAHVIAFSDPSYLVKIYDEEFEDVYIEDVSLDQNDGDDWWYPYLDQIEHQCGNKWIKAIIYSEDLTSYRRFDRSVHYLMDEGTENLSVVPRVFLFGFEDLARALPTFSANLLFEESKSKSKIENRFKIGFDEMPIQAVKLIGSYKGETYKQIFSILLPEEGAMAFATLGEQYDRAIYLRDSADWLKMEDLLFEFMELLTLKNDTECSLNKLNFRGSISAKLLSNNLLKYNLRLEAFIGYFCEKFPLKN
jgi:hypothetical protein